jgi:predicted DCC family thiol-disulfide oxidoreductase YuxK
MSQPPLTVYFDGLCPLCSREIAHYRKRLTGEDVRFVDITDPSFDAAAHGLDTRQVHRVMHIKEGDRLRTGLDAFVALWQRVPGFGWLARLARKPVAHQLLTAAYHAFAFVRPWLPRRKRRCDAGTCRARGPGSPCGRGGAGIQHPVSTHPAGSGPP